MDIIACRNLFIVIVCLVCVQTQSQRLKDSCHHQRKYVNVHALSELTRRQTKLCGIVLRTVILDVRHLARHAN